MATTAREEIIAEWRKQLAEAEEPVDADSQRTAWLTRLKLRLYRFLISLYGDGRWNGSDSDAEESPHAGPFVVSEEALPLTGKPAKDASQIRDVLKSVAEASDGRTKPGPLARGIDRHDLALVQVAYELVEPPPIASHKSVWVAGAICSATLAVLIVSILTLFAVALVKAAWPELAASDEGQVVLNSVMVVALVCLMTSALLYGVFADRLAR